MQMSFSLLSALFFFLFLPPHVSQYESTKNGYRRWGKTCGDFSVTSWQQLAAQSVLCSPTQPDSGQICSWSVPAFPTSSYYSAAEAEKHRELYFLSGCVNQEGGGHSRWCVFFTLLWPFVLQSRGFLGLVVFFLSPLCVHGFPSGLLKSSFYP